MDWSQFQREVPSWYVDAKFGIFIHWGAYSVPAWALPTGELGAVEEEIWFKNNPYAEWYYNTVRIEGSPTWKHHQEVYGGAPYDNFLDMWKAENFDPDSWVDLFARAGARYVVPTTKHHDGITLWDAPGTGTRNTVHRGPKRDLIADLAGATKKRGLHFGVYYSGGLDWSITDLPPLVSHHDVANVRPQDAAYSMYAYEHCMDLIRKHEPEVLWNDIEWPDFSKQGGPEVPYSLAALFKNYYDRVPTGVIDDRWGDTHRDFITSEYQLKTDLEGQGLFENCRGIGYSFGYNQIETEEHYMSVPQLLTHLIDIVSRGGNFLLNVGPTASGEIPTIQRQILEGTADWMAVNSEAIHGTRAVSGLAGSDAPWVRFTSKGDSLFAFVKGSGEVSFNLAASLVHDDTAKQLGAESVSVNRSGDQVRLSVTNSNADLPVVVEFRRRG
jgi:alpha-L-fucosidase